MIVREARLTDGEALGAIYRPYVEKTTITFEYEVPSVTDFQERIANTLLRYPYLVAEVDGEIIGYAYASAYKGRSAYDWSCEVTVYTKENNSIKGVGRALYQGLEEILKRQNVFTLTACITKGNQRSLAFHEKFGYQQVACFSEIGYKFNRWQDVLWLQKELQSKKQPVPDFIPYGNLEKNEN